VIVVKERTRGLVEPGRRMLAHSVGGAFDIELLSDLDGWDGRSETMLTPESPCALASPSCRGPACRRARSCRRPASSSASELRTRFDSALSTVHRALPQPPLRSRSEARLGGSAPSSRRSLTFRLM
jgi:hypothetical protein